MMGKTIRLFTYLVVLALFLAACGPGQEQNAMESPTQAMRDETGSPEMTADIPETGRMAETTTPEMMDETPADGMMEKTGTPAIMMDETPAGDMMKETETPEMMAEKPTETMMEKTGTSTTMMPAWFQTEFTHVVTGETFAIEDFKGKVILLQPFAQWCPTCLQQQKEVMQLHENLGMPEDLVTIGLDIDPNEDAASLRMYLEKHGFGWYYTVADAGTAREIEELYGAQFLNPPSAPMLIIDRHGEAHPLPFGLKSAADLQKALEPFLNEGM